MTPIIINTTKIASPNKNNCPINCIVYSFRGTSWKILVRDCLKLVGREMMWLPLKKQVSSTHSNRLKCTRMNMPIMLAYRIFISIRFEFITLIIYYIINCKYSHLYINTSIYIKHYLYTYK